MRDHKKLLRFIFLAMMVAVGVVISPILRVEGMCPMQALVNVVCSVLMGPYYSLLCSIIIGVIRMITMGIPPLALTGAVFGAFLSGVLYRLSKGNLLFAALGEDIGTGLIGSVVSYPVMTYLWGRTDLTWLIYVPGFTGASIIGSGLAFLVLKQMQKNGSLERMQSALGTEVYQGGDTVVNDAIGIGVLGCIGYLVTVVIVHNFIPHPTALENNMKYIVLIAFVIAGFLYWLKNRNAQPVQGKIQS